MNLKEFAAHLGLSATTVSRALNGSQVVEAKTRAHILAEAARLNYAPSSAARRLATGRSNAFGLFLELERNLMREALFREFLVGLFEQLSRSGSDLIIKPSNAGDLSDYERFYRSGRVDGFVLTRPLINDERIAYLEKKRIPFVVHGPAAPGATYSFLTIDNGASIRALAALLADLGHRRVAFLNDQVTYAFANERQQAFDKVAHDRGFEVLPGFARQLRMDEKNGYDATRTLLGGKARPTAIICGSVLLAEGAYRAIADAGLRVGRDVSVVAHDDVYSDLPADRFRPALTACEGPLTLTGVRLGEFLVRLANGERSETLQETLPVLLIYRASAQPPVAGERSRGARSAT